MPSHKTDIIVLVIIIGILGLGGLALIKPPSNLPSPLSFSPTLPVTSPPDNHPLQMQAYYPSVTSPLSPPSPTQWASTPIPTIPTTSGKLTWSSGYYVAWEQGTYPPSTIPWQDFTYIIHFSLKSNRDGSLQYTHGMTPTYMHDLVTQAHMHHVKALLSVGGDDDQNWDGACGSPATISVFVNSLVSTMQTYGYDGIDLDIEEDPSASSPPTYFGYPSYTGYTQCIQQLRTKLDTITPRPTLSMAVDPSWQAWMASHAWANVDFINMMSYGADANRIGSLISNFTNRGFPKSRLGIGIDFVANANALWCGSLAQYAVQNGVGGIMEWVITEDGKQHGGQTPCLNAIAPYVPTH